MALILLPLSILPASVNTIGITVTLVLIAFSPSWQVPDICPGFPSFIIWFHWFFSFLAKFKYLYIYFPFTVFFFFFFWRGLPFNTDSNWELKVRLYFKVPENFLSNSTRLSSRLFHKSFLQLALPSPSCFTAILGLWQVLSIFFYLFAFLKFSFNGQLEQQESLDDDFFSFQ